MNEVARRKLATKPRGTTLAQASGIWQWSLYISTHQSHARGKKRTVPFLNFLDLSSVSTRLLCISFCPCDFFQDSSTGTGGIQKRELGRERSFRNKSNISFMSRICMLVFFLLNLLILFFYLSIKFDSFIYFFFSLCFFSFFLLLLYYCYFNKRLIQIRHCKRCNDDFDYFKNNYFFFGSLFLEKFDCLLFFFYSTIYIFTIDDVHVSLVDRIFQETYG